MADKEWIEIGRVVGDTGSKGDTGDIGIGTVIKGHYDNYSEFIAVHPSGRLGDAYIVDGSYYYWNENGWANAGSVKGDKGDTGSQGIQGAKGDTGDIGPQGEKGDTGDVGTSVTIKGSYDSYDDLINDHPSGSDGDSYLVNGSLFVWNGSAWINVGNIKGEKGDTGNTGDTGEKGSTGDKGEKGDAFTFEDFTQEQLDSLKGDTGASGFSPTVNVDHTKGEITITTEEGSKTISFDELKGDAGDTGPATDENAGWKLPVDEILTTSTLPTGVSAGYRVAICTESVLAIKEYNGSSWETENLDAYNIIPLKHSGSIQMYLAKSSGPVYMGVDYGVFGKFRFMTQAAYDALSTYDEDTIYFVRS